MTVLTDEHVADPAPDPDVRLCLLGGFELQVDHVPVEVQRAAQRLLALLALAGVAVERSFAASQLWPDTGDERGLANLRSTVWRLRQCRGDLVAASRSHVRLSACVWVDVRQGLADMRHAGPDGVTPEVWSEATLLADLLPDWYDEWLVTERERIRQLRLATLEECGNRLLTRGRAAEGIQLGLRAVALEPLRESPHRLVIRCHLQEGNLVEARRQYARYAELLDRELGAVPTEQIRALVHGVPGPRVPVRW